MRINKKIWCLLASIMTVFPLFLLGAAPTATAADTTQTVVIHNRKYDKIPSDRQNTGDEMKDFSGEPLAGSVFTAYDVTTVYWQAYDKAVGDHTAKEKAGIAAAKAADVTSATGFAFPATNIDGIAEKALATSSGGKNAIYLIKQTTFPSGIAQTKSEPFVIGLPSHKEDGTLREKVHVYPKNEYVTDNLKFIKYGIDEHGNKDKLKDAQFILKGPGGKYYNSTTHVFDLEKEKASKLTSDKEGIVELKDLTLEPGVYEFYEVDSSVATSLKQGMDVKDELYHFYINPKVIVTVSNDRKVTKYEYYDQDLEKQTLIAPFNEEDIAEAYNFKVPEVKKEANDDDVRNGQEVTYTISKKIPEDVKNYTRYELTDTFDDRLELCCSEEKIKKSIKVDGGEPTGLSPAFSKGTNEFTLTFNPANLAKHAKKTLSFQATMKVKAGVDLKKIDNDVVFANSFRDSKDEQKVETYGKRFVKVDSNEDKKLAGAEFIIKNQEGKFMQLVCQITGDKIENITGYASGYTVDWVADEKDATKLISDKDGKFGIYGLGSKEKDYYTLVETKAPDNYVKLKELKFTADKAADGEILKVENKTKGLLPMTGGMGAVGLLSIGLIGLIAGLRYFKKRSMA